MWNCVRAHLGGTGEESPLGILMPVPFNKAAPCSRRWNSFENKNTAELVASLSQAGWCYLILDIYRFCWQGNQSEIPYSCVIAITQGPLILLSLLSQNSESLQVFFLAAALAQGSRFVTLHVSPKGSKRYLACPQHETFLKVYLRRVCVLQS